MTTRKPPVPSAKPATGSGAPATSTAAPARQATAGRELGYARMSTTHEDLTRQLDALAAQGIPGNRIYMDNKIGAAAERDGLAAMLAAAQPGDIIVAATLDRLGHTIRDCLTFVQEQTERGIGVRTLQDPVPIDTSGNSPMAQAAATMLTLLGHMDRVFTLERAAGARASLKACGGSPGRPRKLTDDALHKAKTAVDSGTDVTEVAREHGVSRATLYRYLAELADEHPATAPAELDDATTPVQL